MPRRFTLPSRKKFHLCTIMAFPWASPVFATEVPHQWREFFSDIPVQAHVLSQEEASQIKGALGPAALLIPMATGAAIGTGAYVVGSGNPSAEGAMAAGALGAVAGAASLLPAVPAAIVGGAAGVGGAAVSRVIDTRPVSPYGSFPPGIGSAAACTPWTCSWKDGQPVPYGTPGSTNH